MAWSVDARLTVFLEAGVPDGSYDEMIDDIDPDEAAHLCKAPGHRDVRCAWRGISTRMVVPEHNRCSVREQSDLEDVSRTHTSAVECAAADLVICQDTVFRREAQHSKDFVGLVVKDSGEQVDEVRVRPHVTDAHR